MGELSISTVIDAGWFNRGKLLVAMFYENVITGLVVATDQVAFMDKCNMITILINRALRLGEPMKEILRDIDDIMDPANVRIDEFGRGKDTSVDVGLCGEVDNGVAPFHHVTHCVWVGDVAPNECVPFLIEVFEIV